MTATVSIAGKNITYKLSDMKNGFGTASDNRTTFSLSKDGRIQVKLRDMAESFGASVYYHPNAESVSVYATISNDQVGTNMNLSPSLSPQERDAAIKRNRADIDRPVVSIVDGQISEIRQGDIDSGTAEGFNTYWFRTDAAVPVVAGDDWRHSKVLGADLAGVYSKNYWISPNKIIGVWSTTTPGQKSYYLAKDMATDFNKAYWSLTEPTFNQGMGNAYTLSGSSNEETIWNYLTQYRKLSKIAAAGVMENIKKESGEFDPFLVEAGGGWGLIQWTPAKNIEIAALKKGMSAGATSGNVDDYLLWELDAIWQRGLDRGGKSFWTNMNLEASVGSYTSPPTAKSAGGTQFNGNYKGSGSAYYFHAVVEGSGDMNFGLDAKGVPNCSQKYKGSWHGNILLRPYYAEQILAKHK